MIQYVAFLRGINVGGRKLIKMDALRGIFESMGFKNVRTFIQSGNVIFESANTDDAVLTRRIEKGLLRALGYEVTVVLQKISELEAMIRRNPFKKITPSDDVVMFVTLLVAEPDHKPKLPWQSSTENLEVLAIKNRAAFILCHRKKNGLFAFPNNFFEKQFGVAATTRNWTTINKLVAAASHETSLRAPH